MNNSRVIVKDIDINNIKLLNKNDIYKILYQINDNITIKNIIVKVNNYTIQRKNNRLFLFSNNFGNIFIIDKYLKDNITNFTGIIKYSDKKYYIQIPFNNYTNNSNNFNDKYIYLYINYVKKHNNIPIIHLLNGE